MVRTSKCLVLTISHANMKKIIDLHQDLILYVTRPELYKDTEQTSFEKIKKNNLKVTTVSAFVVPPDENYYDPIVNDLIESDLKKYVDYVKLHPEFVIIKNQNDLKKVVDTEGLYGLILHIEGLNVFNENTGWNLLEKWYEIGLRSIGPMWNLNNPFGGGTDNIDQGLTELGKKLITWCEIHGVLFDFAHMNEKTFWESAGLVTRPILVSHGNSSSICPSPRNYSDKQLKRIWESSGIIGLFLSKKFLSGGSETDLQGVLKHVNHIIAVTNENTVAIGSDFGGILSGFPEGLRSVDDLATLIEKLDDPISIKLAYKNALRVLSQTLI